MAVEQPQPFARTDLCGILCSSFVQDLDEGPQRFQIGRGLAGVSDRGLNGEDGRLAKCLPKQQACIGALAVRKGLGGG